MQRDQVNFGMGDKRVAIYVEPDKKRTYGNRVALQYFEKGSLEAVDRGLRRAKSSGGRKPLMKFSQEIDGDFMETSFVQDRRKPRSCLSSLVAKYRRQGWRMLQLPESADVSLPDHFVQMVRGRSMLYVRVEANEDNGGSIATVSTMSSGQE